MIFEVNPPYGQSDFAVNLGPTNNFPSFFKKWTLHFLFQFQLFSPISEQNSLKQIMCLGFKSVEKGWKVLLISYSTHSNSRQLKFNFTIKFVHGKATECKPVQEEFGKASIQTDKGISKLSSLLTLTVSKGYILSQTNEEGIQEFALYGPA